VPAHDVAGGVDYAGREAVSEIEGKGAVAITLGASEEDS
jgi:hypothetical protein